MAGRKRARKATRRSARIQRRQEQEEDLHHEDDEQVDTNPPAVVPVVVPVTSTPALPPAVIPVDESLMRSRILGTSMSSLASVASGASTASSIRRQRRILEVESFLKLNELEQERVRLEEEYRLLQLSEDEGEQLQYSGGDDGEELQIQIPSTDVGAGRGERVLSPLPGRTENIDQFLQRMREDPPETAKPPQRTWEYTYIPKSAENPSGIFDYHSVKPPKSRAELERERLQRIAGQAPPQTGSQQPVRVQPSQPSGVMGGSRQEEESKAPPTATAAVGGQQQQRFFRFSNPTPPLTRPKIPPPPPPLIPKPKFDEFGLPIPPQQPVKSSSGPGGQQSQKKQQKPPIDPELIKTSKGGDDGSHGGQQQQQSGGGTGGTNGSQQQQSGGSNGGQQQQSGGSNGGDGGNGDKMDQLVAVLTSIATKMGPSSSGSTERFIIRQSHAKDLPSFSGRAEEWPAFLSTYERTTTVCGFTDDENLLRLQRCLKGEALKAVQSLLVSPFNLSTAMDMLKARFGQPKHIIEAMISRAKAIPSIREDRADSLIEFGTAVINLTTTIKSMKEEQHLSNPHLVNEMESKLPFQMRMRWMRWVQEDVTRNEDLTNFSFWLRKEVEIACKLCPPKVTEEKDKRSREQHPPQQQKKKVFTALENSDIESPPATEKRAKVPFKCYGCEKEGHSISSCSKFKGSTSEDRWKSVRKHNLCYSCLRPGHPTSECRKKQKCPEEGCKYTHHHLLHKSSTRPVNKTAELSDEEDTSPADGKVNKVHTAATKSQVLLRVLPVLLKGPKGNVEVHALCDEGSTVTLLEEDIADLLGLQGPQQSLCLQFLGKDGKKMENSRKVEVQIQGLQKNCKSFSLSNVRTVKGLGLSSQMVDVEQLKSQHQYLRSIPLPAMREVTPVLLLGADHFRLITPRKVVEGTSTGPVATECLLGWSVGGDSRRRGKATSNPSYHLCESGDDELHRLVKESFTKENFGVKVTQSNIRSREDVRAEAILKETTKRIGHRYETGLLWKSSNFILPESKSMAFMRLKCTERRMDKDASFAQQYNLKIAEYLTKGYVRKLSPEEAAVTTTRTFYLPHFGVTSPNKPGKFRLVFDAAAKAMGYSLNDFIVSGPDLLQPLPEVLHKFREGRIAFTGDIADMFHRVAVREEDQDSQRFLWRGMERHQEPDVYVMQVMTFGATCSPCSATFVKNLNAEENKDDFPKTWREVIESFYVDDYLGVADSEDDAAKKIADIIEINRRGNFNVTNWTCNSRAVLETIPLEQRSKELKSITPGAELPMERVLGLVWDPENDNFTFRLNFHKVKEEISSGAVTPTKREVLKLVMSIFDPLGFLSHFTMKAKVLLQSIWRSEVGWDDPITERQESVWRHWIAELQYITIVQIPRCYDVDYNKSEVQLHVFVDASEAAFSAVCYFRISNGDRVTTALVGAKSKVAPLKQLSIPRLELQGALLGTRLAASLTRGHRRTISRTVFWSDSKTVLCWLRQGAIQAVRQLSCGRDFGVHGSITVEVGAQQGERG
jgi:hypothetical protein